MSEIPALVDALGNSAINLTAQTLFDAQMEKIYGATSWDADRKAMTRAAALRAAWASVAAPPVSGRRPRPCPSA